MATKTWIYAANSAGAWSTAGNWSPTGAPGTTDTAVFDSGTVGAIFIATGTGTAENLNVIGDYVTLTGAVFINTATATNAITDIAGGGQVTVTSQASLNTNGILIVGSSSSSAVTAGTLVDNGTSGQSVVYVGYYGAGTATVSGAGAVLSSADDTFVGSGEAAGLLTVENGAETYTLGTFYVGGLAAGGTAGTVVVTGSGSVLSAPTLSIGSLSGGLLSVEAGASATGTSTTIDPLGELQIDAQSTFTGAITLAGGILDAGAAQGGSTAGTVALANTVTVTGSGSQLQSDGPTLDLTGLVSGSGNLTINSGVVELDDASNSLTGTIENFADLVLGNATAGGTATVAFTAGLPSQLTVAGTASPGVTVTGFGPTNVIDLEGLTYVAGFTTATVAGNRIVVTDGASTETIKATGLTNGATYRTQADASGGTEIVACYCIGTLVLTDRGEASVEDLAIGDRVVTAAGLARPVRWIGRRSYAGRFLAAQPAAHPIRFLAGSLSGGLPRRDLLVSPEHAMFLDGVLIPARCLVNGTSVVRERGLGRVDYVHVELDSHDVILAEGAPSETFMDDNSRGMLHNAAEFASMYPDAAMPDGYCARRVEHGAELEAIRRRLTVVAGEMAQAA